MLPMSVTHRLPFPLFVVTSALTAFSLPAGLSQQPNPPDVLKLTERQNPPRGTFERTTLLRSRDDSSSLPPWLRPLKPARVQSSPVTVKLLSDLPEGGVYGALQPGFV